MQEISSCCYEYVTKMEFIEMMKKNNIRMTVPQFMKYFQLEKIPEPFLVCNPLEVMDIIIMQGDRYDDDIKTVDGCKMVTFKDIFTNLPSKNIMTKLYNLKETNKRRKYLNDIRSDLGEDVYHSMFTFVYICENEERRFSEEHQEGEEMLFTRVCEAYHDVEIAIKRAYQEPPPKDFLRNVDYFLPLKRKI